MQFSSFAITEMVLEEADTRFAPAFQRDSERTGILRQYCQGIDRLIEENSGEAFEAEVDEINMTVKLSITIPDLEVFDGGRNLFQQLVERSLKLHVACADEGNILLELTYPSLWVKSA